MTMTTDPERRQAFVAGLRELADFLAANPAVAVPDHSAEKIILTPYGSDEECERAIDAFAEAVGAEVDDDRAGTGKYSAAREFGMVRYEAFTYTAAVMAESAARRSYEKNVQTGGVPAGLGEAA